MTYEEAIQKLEAISQQMEQGSISIDDLTKQLQEAQKLIKFCRDRLTKIDTELKGLLDTDDKE
ncbi:MAG: exodeoxyribonuclease VII small subunit [Bacteroidaceae bacterium]|nr:exodeoxyribonuclease VII small subunit [Bacteroidaceae bacterium]